MKDIDKKTQAMKLKALKLAMNNLVKSTKDENIVQILGEKPLDTKERIPTSYLTLDVATGGGIPRGRIVELFGAESSGKSLISQRMISAAQSHGALCAYVDMEQTFDASFARKLEVDTDSLVVSQPNSLQQAFQVIDALIDAGVDLIILDSVAALVPEEEMEAEVGKQTVGLVARYMSQFLRRINVKIAKTESVLVCINQVRDKIGMMGYGDPTTTGGGRALKFYSSLRLKVQLSSEGKLKDSASGDPVGQGIKVTVVKNKTAPPFKKAEFRVYFDGRKVDETDQIVEIALAYGLIPRYNSKGQLDPKGRTYKWNTEPNFKASSKDSVKSELEKFPKVKEELLDMILNGDTTSAPADPGDVLDADKSDDDFEEEMREGKFSEAEEIEEEDKWDD